MKSLIESLIGESGPHGPAPKPKDADFNWKDFAELYKSLFCWSSLSNVQKEVIADMFDSHGNVYEQIKTFRDNSDYGSPKYKAFTRAMDMSKTIFNALSKEIQ